MPFEIYRQTYISPERLGLGRGALEEATTYAKQRAQSVANSGIVEPA